MNITIKILNTNNAYDFRTIRLSALLKAPKMFGSIYEIEVKQPLSFFQTCLSHSAVFAAYQDMKIIGVAILTRENSIKTIHKAYLTSLFVEPVFQQKGIANQLLTSVMTYARKQGLEQILLTVVDDNNFAIHLYEKFGFEIYGTEYKAIKYGEEYINEFLMKLFIIND